jgi:hypothetical protein
MIKVATILRIQLAVAAVALSTSGAAYALDIGCVDGTPAPPFTQTCPSSSIPTRAFDQAPVGHNGYCARYRSYDAASGTYLGRDGGRHVCQ